MVRLYVLLLLVACNFDLEAQGPPSWSVNPALYQYSMTGFIRVIESGAIYMNEPGSMIAAYVGHQLRGAVPASDIIFVGPDAYFPITIFSNQTQGEQLNFEVYIPSGDSIFQAVEVANFNRFETLGSPPAPFLINLEGDCPSLLQLDASDLPLVGTYQAGTEIVLDGVTQIEAGASVVFDAPIVRASQQIDISIGASMTVRGDGCD